MANKNRVTTPFTKSLSSTHGCFLKGLAVPAEDSVVFRTGVTGMNPLLLHSNQQVKSNTQTPSAFMATTFLRHMVFTEQLSQQHICRSQCQSQSREKRTLIKCLLCVRDCASHFNALPFTPSHHIASHLSICPFIWRDRRDSRCSNWWWCNTMAAIT